MSGSPANAGDGDGALSTASVYAADMVLPFQLDRASLRGRVIRLGPSIDRILTQHRYPHSVSALLSETALLTAMIGQAMKPRGGFSVQTKSNGPISMLTADYFPPAMKDDVATIRAYAQFDRDETPERSDAPYDLVGTGVFAMTIDQGARTMPYQGLTPLVEGGLAASAAAYFAQSEQIATRFALATALSTIPGESPQWRAGGIMLQHLGEPGESAQIPDAPSGEDGLLSAQDIADMGDRADDWRRATLLLDTVEDIELIGPTVTPEQLLLRLFHEERPRVFDAQPMNFGCTCNREQILDILRGYPVEDRQDLLSDKGDISADCQFCGSHYHYEGAELMSE